MEASDEEFDTEEVRKLVKRLDEKSVPLEKVCGKIYIRETKCCKNCQT